LAECSKDEQQDSWRPILEVGPKIPANLRNIFEQSKVDFQMEPLGCAIPSDHLQETFSGLLKKEQGFFSASE